MVLKIREIPLCSVIDAWEAFGAKLPPTCYDLATLLPNTHFTLCLRTRPCLQVSEETYCESTRRKTGKSYLGAMD